jgi:isocitrate dehydrogenase
MAQGFGSLGLITSLLITPNGGTIKWKAVHETVTKHYRKYQPGKKTSTNPMALFLHGQRGWYLE